MRRSRTRVEVVWKGRMVTGEQWALWSVDGKKLKRVPAWQVLDFRRPKPKRRATRPCGKRFPGTVSLFGPDLRITEGHGL